MKSAHRHRNRNAPGEIVTDQWSGGADILRGTWPGESFTKQDHEHAYHDGGFYAHRHRGGDQPHTHQYHCPCNGDGQFYQGEHATVPVKPAPE